MIGFSKEREAQKVNQEIKWYEGWNAEEIFIIKTAAAKFQAYLKINSNKKQTQKGKPKEI